MYRSRQEREEQRKEKGGKTTSSDWMRKCGATTVLNISATKDNQLAKAVEKALSSCPAPSTTVTKVQERPGRSVREALVKGNPFHRPSCGRKFCPWVARGEECQGLCYREGVGYLATCILCVREQLAARVKEEDVVHRMYIGESHRSLPFRLERHIDDYRPLLRKRRGGGAVGRRPRGLGGGEVGG